MDDSETHRNAKFAKTDTRSAPRAEPDVSYAELKFKTRSQLQVRTDADGLTPIYSELNFRKDDVPINEIEDPPIASAPGRLPDTEQRDAHKQEPSENIGNRWHCKICPLCLTMFVLVAIVVGLSIYVLQLRQSLIICDRNYRRLWKQHQEMNRTQLQYQLKVHELNSTLESRISEYSRISTLENNITVLNSDLSVLNRAHTNLRHQFNHVDMKYKNITESKAQICQYLTRRREQTCFQDWIRKADRCYFISTLKTSYIEAKEHCSNFDARLLEINSKAEENIVFNAVSHHYGAYRCGKCEDGEETSSLIYKYSTGRPVCVNCDSDGWRNYCNHQHRFICKKCAHSCTDIPERIQGLCQQSIIFPTRRRPEPNAVLQVWPHQCLVQLQCDLPNPILSDEQRATCPVCLQRIFVTAITV
ncbi:uncharacterized protein [Mobula birostris]|uniref:uncharacterized protein n=1 Tax=Mobula birostris TaxID=1983395 RepID=UPI003B28B147